MNDANYLIPLVFILICLMLSACQADNVGGGSHEASCVFRLSNNSGSDYLPSLAIARDGSFVTVLNSAQAEGEAHIQKFDPTGRTMGNGIPVSETATYGLEGSIITMNTQGRFVVIWLSWEVGDSESFELKGRLFDSNAVGLGDEFEITAKTGSVSYDTAAAMAEDGSFIVALTTTDLEAQSDSDIEVRRFDAIGQPVSEPIAVSESSEGRQENARLALSPDGTFAVAWTSDEPGAKSSSQDQDVYVRFFDASGSALTGDLIVNETGDGRKSTVGVHALPDGGFLIFWEDDYFVYCRKFSAVGSPIGESFRLELGMVEPHTPTIAPIGTREMIAAWRAYEVDPEQEGYDTLTIVNDESIYMRRLDAAGNATGLLTVVNEDTVVNGSGPSLAVAENGSIVIGWSTSTTAGSRALARLIASDPDPVCYDPGDEESPGVNGDP
jgi:hypothetical protein